MQPPPRLRSIISIDTNMIGMMNMPPRPMERAPVRIMMTSSTITATTKISTHTHTGGRCCGGRVISPISGIVAVRSGRIGAAGFSLSKPFFVVIASPSRSSARPPGWPPKCRARPSRTAATTPATDSGKWPTVPPAQLDGGMTNGNFNHQ